MMIFGKLVAGLLGLITAGPIGLVIGLVLGHFFDRGLSHNLRVVNPETIGRIQASFFETTFLLLGYIAKADGRVSEQEVAHTETIFVEMGLGATQRREAIDLFRRGSAQSFHPATTVTAFAEVCGPQRQLQQAMLVFLISLAMADGRLDGAEHDALRQIASLMGFGAGPLEELLRMARAQEQFHSHRSAGREGGSLADAYQALGVDRSASDQDIKRAYRKLMSANHPDKLIAQGLPEDMIRLATEKSQEIQAAYDRVKSSRG
jgi:DnaJ like chaperone protein